MKMKWNLFGSFRLLYHHIFKWLWNEKVFWNIQIENLLTSFYCLSKLLGWSINEQVTVSKGYDFSYCGSNMAHIYIYKQYISTFPDYDGLI